MRGIIVGIDGSDHAYHALEWAVREAAIRQAPLTVLTAYQPAASYWGKPVLEPAEEDLAEQAREMAHKETDTALAKAVDAAPPPSVTVRAVTGQPAEALLQAAQGADLLVVGARGTGGFKRLRLGSVSTQITHHARCPVVIVPDVGTRTSS
jgi:nucleotide-binding universal stress UspA family protein